jgi:hypothetical protein
VKAQVENAEATVTSAEDEFQRLRLRDEEELRATAVAVDDTVHNDNNANNNCDHIESINTEQDISIHSPLQPPPPGATEFPHKEKPDEKRLSLDGVTEHNSSPRDDSDSIRQVRRSSVGGDAVDILEEGGEDTVIY